jgi:hypothetical protein
MTYTTLKDRSAYETAINTILNILNGGENDWIKGEMFGYFVNRICFGFLDNIQNVAFNSSSFSPGNIKTLNSSSDQIIIQLKKDPFVSAADLNYVISAVYWGFLGKSVSFSNTNYGIRAYLIGVIEHIQHSLNKHYGSGGTAQAGSAVMSFRRYILVSGVLRDVVTETNHVDMRSYKDLKRRENGDIWNSGKLNVEEKDTRQPHEMIKRS